MVRLLFSCRCASAPALLICLLLGGILLLTMSSQVAVAQDTEHTEVEVDAHATSPVEHNEHGEHSEEDGHAEHAPDLGTVLPLWSTLPFIGILLSIAVFPLVAPHFWHRHFPRISAAWALMFAIPFLIVYRTAALQEVLHIYVADYIPFIILLWALFTAAGGIFVGGSMSGSPKVNLVLLLIGTLIASWIGTTGAAMVMIRPLLRANSWRRYKVHTIVFFIFLVANVGGSLTPLGDPPLFLGFLHGVPFFWVTKALLPHAALVAGMLLVIFFLVDTYFYKRETAEAPKAKKGERGIRIEGLQNLIFLLGVMAGVIFSGSVKLAEIPVYGHVVLPLQNLIRDVFLVAMGLLSLHFTRKSTREQNEFSWFPIKEVAYLFAGIFMTIVPALAILRAGTDGALAGLVAAVQQPWQYFWVTGSLSSFLDNAPTYLTFYNTALGSLGVAESAVPGMLGYLDEHLRNPAFIHDLTAISVGAVFMGAMTYIGNAPNFMVKAIAEESGIPMPSFFGYILKYSIPILLPVFAIATWIFFVD